VPDNKEQIETIVPVPKFRWRYIIFPLVVLILSIAIVAYFYRLLPPEVAYHFAADGSPDRWVSRGTFILFMLLPQFFLTLMAGAMIWGITRLATRFRTSESTGVGVEGILSLMGNIVALPQIILGFAMLDIFSYNSYQVRLLSLLAFTLIVMGLGGVVIAVFFVRAVTRVFKAN